MLLYKSLPAYMYIHIQKDDLYTMNLNLNIQKLFRDILTVWLLSFTAKDKIKLTAIGIYQ